MFNRKLIPGLAGVALLLAGCGQEWEVEAQPARPTADTHPVSSSTAPGQAQAGSSPTTPRGTEESWNSGEGRHVAVDALEWGLLVLDKSNRLGYVTGPIYRGWRADVVRIERGLENGEQFQMAPNDVMWLYDTGQILFWLQWYSFKVEVNPLDRQMAWRVYTGGYPLYVRTWERVFGAVDEENMEDRPKPIANPPDLPEFKMGTYPIHPLVAVPRA